MSAAELQYVEANGARLACLVQGGSDATKPLLITLHGGRGFGTHASDAKAFAPLSDAYRVLSFDMRGHGQSSVTPSFTFAQLVDDIDGLRKYFAGDEPAVICGGSFGGMIAQQYALTYPENTRALILRGTAPSHHHEEGAFKILEDRLYRAPMASKEMLQKVFGAFENDDEMKLIMFAIGPLYSEDTHDPNTGLATVVHGVYRAQVHNDLYCEKEKYFDYRSRLSSVKAPTFIVVGEEDWICPVDQSELIHSLISGSRLLKVPGANHPVHISHNDLVIRELRKFLKEVEEKR